jgi:hypothetical protein
VDLNSGQMDELDQEPRAINAPPEGESRLRAGVTRVGDAVTDGVGAGASRARLAVEDAGWFLREHLAWPLEDGLGSLGRRGQIGVFGGGGIALAGVVAALLLATSGGSGSQAGTTEAFVSPPPRPAPAKVVAPTPAPRPKVAKPSGPTLHGAPPVFSPAEDVRSGVGDGKALGKKKADGPSGGVSAERSAGDDAAEAAATASSVPTNETPASSARIGATPAATASAQAQADALKATTSGAPKVGGDSPVAQENGPPAPKAAKEVAREFAEAFVVYETGGVDGKVRHTFGATSTKQLSKSLLKRPPRQPATVKVPRAKVVNVVAGPSHGEVYSVSVSLLRVGVTSELRLQMEQGVGKKWQVTNVLG